MTKSQIEEERAPFEKSSIEILKSLYDGAASDSWFFIPNGDGYLHRMTDAAFKIWLAAKQDSETQEAEFLAEMTKAIEQSSGGNSFCRYCGTGNENHLPNCKGAK